MKKIIVACDSFKGSMSAKQVCSIISRTLKEKYPDVQIREIPVADGGEGTVDAYLHTFNGEKVYCKAYSPLFNEIEAYFGIINGDTAVIECAAASGITIEKENNALSASSYGTGQIIKAALDRGIKTFIIGLGGSATTDAGTGMLSALGIRFFDEDGNAVLSGGLALSKIKTINTDSFDKRIYDSSFTVLCDVTNPLYGKNGAAYVYAPQKGANGDDVVLLDKGLESFAEVCKGIDGTDYSSVQGAGAAGGIGFATLRFLNARLKRGIDTILDVTDFDIISSGCDLVITGEGKMDSQSLCGKVPFGVSGRSKAEKCIALVGLLDENTDKTEIKQLGIDEVIETNPLHLPFETILPTCMDDLKRAAANIIL